MSTDSLEAWVGQETDSREEHELARNIRRASATECQACGHRLEYVVSRFAYRHVTQPEDGHAPRPRPLGL